MFASRLRWCALALAACSSADQVPAPGGATEAPEAVARTGIDGCNCAGAAPAMTAPDGLAYPFQSVVAYYYQVLQAAWTKVGEEQVLDAWLPDFVEQTGEAFYEWQAKSLQIYRDRDELAYSHRYYRGIFGFLEGAPGEGEPAACAPALDPGSRIDGMLAHIGLSQAGVCGENDDGTTKFWQVNQLALLPIGEVFDGYELIASGLATPVQTAPVSRCILPNGTAPPLPLPGGGSGSSALSNDPVIPCVIAFRGDAVTEGVVLPVPSSAVVSGVPLGHRGFTAAGTVQMPNALDEVRTILRSHQLRAMFAIGLPRFVPEPSAGPTAVRLVGHRIGPASSPSPVLLPEERAWVDRAVQRYESACCRVECSDARALGAAGLVGEEAGEHGGGGYGGGVIVGVHDAGVLDAGMLDAGVLDAYRSDAYVPDAYVLDAPYLDAGWIDGGFDGGFVDAGIPVPADGGPFPVPADGGTFPFPADGGTFPIPTDGGTFPIPTDGGTFPIPTDGGTLPIPTDGGTPPPPPPPPPPPVCRTVCVAEGVCETSTATQGLVVMVSSATTKECFGSCPEPAAGSDVPAGAPTCEP